MDQSGQVENGVFSLQNATHPLATETALPKFCPIHVQIQDDHTDPRELLGPCQYQSLSWTKLAKRQFRIFFSKTLAKTEMAKQYFRVFVGEKLARTNVAMQYFRIFASKKLAWTKLAKQYFRNFASKKLVCCACARGVILGCDHGRD